MTEQIKYYRCRLLSVMLDWLGFHACAQSDRNHLFAIRLWRWLGKRGRRESRFFGEYYINRRFRFRFLPDFEIAHQSDGDEPGSHWMLSFGWLWFCAYQRIWHSKATVPNKVERNGVLVECSEYEGHGPEWGWSFFMDSLHCHWGYRSRLIGLPFLRCYFEKREYLTQDQKTVTYVEQNGGRGKYRQDEEIEKAKVSRQFAYRYVCRDGEVQNVIATVFVDRMTWRRKWTPLRLVRTSIDVSFSKEVGEGRGSWKGGCIGCGYDMRPGETAEQCLRRMEQDRSFSR